MLLARRTLLRQGLACCDTAVLLLSFGVAYLLVAQLYPQNYVSFRSYVWLLTLIIPIWLASLSALGFYGPAVYSSARRLIGRLLQAQCISGLLLFSAMYLIRSESVSRLLMQTFLILGLFFLYAQKFAIRGYLLHQRLRPARGRRKILLVSFIEAAEHYTELMREHAPLQADIVGLLTPEPSSYSGTAASRCPLGTVDDLPSVLQTQVVDEVVADSKIEPRLIDQLSRCCSTRGILLRIMVEMPRPTLGVWAVEHFGGGAFLLSLSSLSRKPHQILIKRVIDVAGASVGLFLCGVTYAWFGLRLRRESGGSALFRQHRVGWNGRRFILYKFRTMRSGAERIKDQLASQNAMNGPLFKLQEDPRVTPTGRRLRRRHLDELPQFWNVLKGEMSLVGTRPPTEDEAAVYAEHHQRRLSLKPGLTGLWQLSGNAVIKDFEEVVKLDCKYIDNWSLWLDLWIIGKTLVKVIRGDAW